MAKSPSSAVTLTLGQRSILLQRATRWCRVALEARERHEPRIRAGDVQKETNLLAIALEHLDICLGLLEPGLAPELHRRAGAYRCAWNAVSRLRDALEHEEEYLAGRGTFPDLLGALGDWPYGVEGNVGSWSYEGGVLVGVSALGKDYPLTDVLTAAAALKDALEHETGEAFCEYWRRTTGVAPDATDWDC